MIELVVTGTGRCGTRWISEWLSHSRLRCGHELAFSYRGWTPEPGYRADSSWLAVPYLGLVDVRIVHLVRHPLLVVRSFLGTHHFGPFKRWHRGRIWWQFMAHAWGYREGEPPAHAAVRYWVEWNRRIEEHTDERYRIEDLPDERFLRSLGLAPGPVPPRTVNQHRRAELERLPREAPEFPELEAMAERYGYDPTTL